MSVGFAAGAGLIFTTSHVTDAASATTNTMKTTRPISPSAVVTAS